MSSATSRLGRRHSQWSCGAKMLRIIISIASAIWANREPRHNKNIYVPRQKNIFICAEFVWCLNSSYPGQTSEDGQFPLKCPKAYGLHSIFYHECVWSREKHHNVEAKVRSITSVYYPPHSTISWVGKLSRHRSFFREGHGLQISAPCCPDLLSSVLRILLGARALTCVTEADNTAKNRMDKNK